MMSNFSFAFSKKTMICLFLTILKTQVLIIQSALNFSKFCTHLIFFDKAYDVVRSPHMIKEHCKAKMDYTEPVHYTLRGSSGNQMGSYSYVPISEVLRKYCSHEDVWNQILSENNDGDEQLLSDYRDGFYFKEHLIFRKHPGALRLHLYEDEFEIVNPLGSKRTKYKLCAFYYTIGNLSGKYRSQLKHIHLALLARYSHVKQFGMDVGLYGMD